jgi:hypothetical protein
MTNAEFGRATEARFVMDALSRGLLVSRPTPDAPGYDAVVDCRGSLKRVQVKGSRPSRGKPSGRSRRVYRVNVGRRRRSGKINRRHKRYDVLAVWLNRDNSWLFIPRRRVKGNGLMNLTIGGSNLRRLDNWNLFL